MARQDVAHRERSGSIMDSLSERGVQWTPLNDEVANVLGLKNGQVQRLCQIALCDTVKLVQIFFDLY